MQLHNTLRITDENFTGLLEAAQRRREFDMTDAQFETAKEGMLTFAKDVIKTNTNFTTEPWTLMKIALILLRQKNKEYGNGDEILSDGSEADS